VAKFTIAPIRTKCGIAGLLVTAPLALAQDPESSVRSPAQAEPPSALQKLVTADTELAPGDSFRPVAAFNNPLRWGPVEAKPHLNLGVSYGDGLQAAPGSTRKTVIETFSPGMLFEVGKLWDLDYTPTLTFYSHKDFRDTLGHNVILSGGAKWDEWKFGVSQRYSISSQPLIETARQTEQEIYTTVLDAAHPFGRQLLLQMSVNQHFRFAESFNSARSWSTMEWLNYQFTPRMSGAVGFGFGLDDVGVGADMMNEQLQGRVNTRVAEKINLSLSGGAEVREFLRAGLGELINPIFGASVQYRPFKHTTFSISGNRRVSPSLFQDQLTEASDISLGFDQRLLGMFHFSLSGAFGQTDYIFSSGKFSTTRTDETSRIHASLQYPFWQTASASIFYQSSRNTSSSRGFAFSNTNIGFNLGYHF
jgi:hypothetical protein